MGLGRGLRLGSLCVAPGTHPGREGSTALQLFFSFRTALSFLQCQPRGTLEGSGQDQLCSWSDQLPPERFPANNSPTHGQHAA